MSQWSLVRYERGEVKLLCHGAGSQLLPSGKQPGYPEGKPVAQGALSLATETSLPLAFSVSTLSGRFCANLAGWRLQGSRLDPAPTKVTDTHDDFSATE